MRVEKNKNLCYNVQVMLRLKNFLFKDFCLFDYMILLGSFILNLVLTIVFKSSILNFFSTLFSVLNMLYLAKGKFVGFIFEFFTILFYSLVCFKQGLYGEIVVYVGIFLPMSIFALVNWLKNKNGDVVSINKVKKLEIILACLSMVVTFIPIYFLLKVFKTELLVFSTLNVCLSIISAYFIIRRSVVGFYVYLLFDAIQLVIWTIFIVEGQYHLISVAIMPIVYFINEIYAIYLWNKRASEQSKINQKKELV